MKREIKNLHNGPFDLLVIGGGIYGAWTAYDAALRGLKVALIDKGDWASGTSSGSSKLIHGGLRYLEHFQFRLVKKSLEERKRLANLAPHRIRHLRFLIPVFKGNRVGPWRLKTGLWIYDRLAGKENGFPFHESLDREQTIERYPFLKETNLLGGFTYSDGQTDDFRMTLEILDGAYEAGAVMLNYVEAKDLVKENGRIKTVKLWDHLENKAFEIEASIVVNTTGPWASQFTNGEGGHDILRLTKGIHLIVPPIPCKDALLLTAQSDGRVFFVIPWYGKTLIGTTDTDFHGNPDHLEVTEEEADYLLSEVNLVFRELKLDRSCILGKYAGLRALCNEAGKDPSSISREWSLLEPLKNLLVSIGGKFTSARIDAVVIVDRVMEILDRPYSQSHPTDSRPFPWCPPEKFELWKEKTIRQGIHLGLDPETAEWCTFRYGSKIVEIYHLLQTDQALSGRIVPDIPFCLGEVIQSVQKEMVVHLEDILRRRVPVGLLTRVNKETITKIAMLVSPILDWSTEDCKKEIHESWKNWNPSWK